MRAILPWYQKLDKCLQKGNDRLISKYKYPQENFSKLSTTIYKRNNMSHISGIYSRYTGSTSETQCKTPYQLAKEGKSYDYTNAQEKH